MTYDEFNAFCGSLAATSHVIQWGGAHVWKVGDKVFAIGGWHDDQEAFTFKVSEMSFEILKEERGVRPAPYLASRGMKWIQRYDESFLNDQDLKRYLRESHRIVSLGLSKKRQKALGLNQTAGEDDR
ncbi:MmcQ/YjbR family DNA-binding protein [Bauldia litoralis]|uniref:MmcQ/YjbR family DNA-binding protein n=1 Tax=Bauldia litoralis TaxID=665467 RepID=UPI003264F728